MSLEDMDSTAKDEIQISNETTDIEKTDVSADLDTVYANQNSTISTSKL